MTRTGPGTGTGRRMSSSSSSSSWSLSSFSSSFGTGSTGLLDDFLAVGAGILHLKCARISTERKKVV